MPSFDTPGRVALVVEIPGGDVSIETWDEPRVDIDVSPGRGDDASAQAAAGTTVEAAERAGRHEVTVRAPKREGRLGIFGRSPELRVRIACPEGADLELTTHSADLVARGRMGNVVTRSASGDALVGETADLSVTTASGDLAAGAVGGQLTTKSASGDVDVKAVAGPASVNTVSGDVRLGETGGAVTVNTVSGDADLEGLSAGARISAVSGDVSVAARPGLALWIDAQSVSGSLNSDLDVGDAPVAADGPQVELRIRTVSGDVRITRAAPVSG